MALCRSREICFYFLRKIEMDLENKTSDDVEVIFYGREKQIRNKEKR